MTDVRPHSAWRALTVAGALVTVLAGLARPAALAAQHEGHAAPQPGTAAARVGTVTFASPGAPAAQPPFLHGLALLHNFQYSEAAAAYRQLSTNWHRADPALRTVGEARGAVAGGRSTP